MPSSPPFLIIAVDGGAASGKSTVARALAQRFHLLHADTGAYYRSVTFALLQAKVPAGDAKAVEGALPQLSLETLVEGNAARLAIGGTPPKPADLRSQEVNAKVSRFAALPVVRKFLLDFQRGQAEVARHHGFAGLIMEGRDIGSAIFPHADLKLFLTADPAIRAHRRAAEGVTDAVAERDRLDATRETSPMSCPPGAKVVDSSHLTQEEVVAHIGLLVNEARRTKSGKA
jgi:cytidylate kinase